MRKYVLQDRTSGLYMVTSVSSNDGADFANENTVSIYPRAKSPLDAEVWTTDSKLVAHYVRDYSTPWYNSSMETPKHDYEPGDGKLQVVELKISIEATVRSGKRVPNMREVLVHKQRVAKSKTEKAELQYWIDQYDSGKEFGQPMIYDLLTYSMELVDA